jgi:hypothetical protein
MVAAVAVKQHADQPQVERGDRGDAGADDGSGHRGVVRDGVDELEAPVGDAAVDHLDGGQHTGDGGKRVGRRDTGACQLGCHHERDLGLDAGLQKGVEGDLVTLIDEHVVEQHSEVGLAHPQQVLRGPRRQPDLPTPDHGSCRDTAVDVVGLDRVGVGDRQIAPAVAEGFYRGAFDLGMPQRVDEPDNGGGDRALHRLTSSRRSAPTSPPRLTWSSVDPDISLCGLALGNRLVSRTPKADDQGSRRRRPARR